MYPLHHRRSNRSRNVKHISLDREDERIQQFLCSLPLDPEGSVLELHGQPVLRVLPPASRTTAEQDDLVQRARELIDRARQRNRGVSAREIEREVAQAVDQVRRRKPS
jgi:hypothetical protein